MDLNFSADDLAFHDMVCAYLEANLPKDLQYKVLNRTLDMHTPGITVRPIIMLGEDHEVNEVFFDNVRIPVENLVGEENKGWTSAKCLLGHERAGIAAVGRQGGHRPGTQVHRAAGDPAARRHGGHR